MRVFGLGLCCADFLNPSHRFHVGNSAQAAPVNCVTEVIRTVSMGKPGPRKNAESNDISMGLRLHWQLPTQVDARSLTSVTYLPPAPVRTLWYCI
jgi:hypothetical protein